MIIYTYAVSTDLPDGLVNIGKLHAEIAASPILTAIERVDLVGDQLDVVFKAALSAEDKTLLDGNITGPAGGLLAAHENTPDTNDPDRVEITNQARLREDGSLYAVSKPSSFGMEMNDRDFRISTCTLTDAVEDLKYNPFTMKEEPWSEMTLNGVYKDDNGTMVPVADQADADLNGILSVYDFSAKFSGVPVTYEMRDGILYVDPSIFSDAANPTYAERFGHRAYSIIAPGIPGNLGGSIAVFDGYLGGTPDLKVEALSPQAVVLDPAGPAGAAGVLLRLAIFHPAGSKLHHVMRLVMYRAPGTF